MKHTTDQLLTLGMALTSDRRSMERRVRGVFARKRSAKSVLALSLVLALTLGFAAFTTACQPGQPLSTDGNAVVSGGDAVASGGNAVASSGNAVVSGGDAAKKQEYTKENTLHWLAFMLNEARKFPAPRMEGIAFTEHGSWSVQKKVDVSEQATAVNRFLELANAIFVTSYTQDDIVTTYYIDQSGFRTDVWRFDSKDGVLSGALDAKNLSLISADCVNEPVDQVHDSIAKENSYGDNHLFFENLDASPAAERVAKILGGVATDIRDYGGSGHNGNIQGWMIKQTVLFSFGDGRYCAVNVFGDKNLTPTSVCVYPDFDCVEDSVFWRADLESKADVVQLFSPQDFRDGQPAQDDMTRETAIAFFNKLVEVAGCENIAAGETPPEPSTDFLVDFSRTRENFWRIEGSGIILELTSKTGRILSLSSNGSLGTKLGLSDARGGRLSEQDYLEISKAFYTALLGKESVVSASFCGKDELSNYTLEVHLADGTVQQVTYHKGMIVKVVSFFQIDPNTWTSVPKWLEKWARVDETTGGVLLTGFENGTLKTVPNWIADWVYINNETGEIFIEEW